MTDRKTNCPCCGAPIRRKYGESAVCEYCGNSVLPSEHERILLREREKQELEAEKQRAYREAALEARRAALESRKVREKYQAEMRELQRRPVEPVRSPSRLSNVKLFFGIVRSLFGIFSALVVYALILAPFVFFFYIIIG